MVLAAPVVTAAGNKRTRVICCAVVMLMDPSQRFDMIATARATTAIVRLVTEELAVGHTNSAATVVAMVVMSVRGQAKVSAEPDWEVPHLVAHVGFLADFAVEAASVAVSAAELAVALAAALAAYLAAYLAVGVVVDMVMV